MKTIKVPEATELEVGQAGLCDERCSKKWYALNQEGDMVFVGEFEDFTDADESLEYSPVWLVDEETARMWLSQLTELLTCSPTPKND